MNFFKLPDNLPIPEDDGKCDHLLNKKLPDISLENQDGYLLKLNRKDTFRIILFCYPMTGHPEKELPLNWNQIPGATGCTPQNFSFRDNYDELIKLNSIPIGMTTQEVKEIKEMTLRLNIPYDILSDNNLNFSKIMNLPTFSVDNKTFIKRLTLIIEKSVIKKIFYPIFPPDIHIKDVIYWLESN